MLKAVRFNRAGEPPSLDAYLHPRWAAQFSEIRRERLVFVPVGLELRTNDSQRLASTSWNARLVRTGHRTRAKSSGGSMNSNVSGSEQWLWLSHTAASLTDWVLCRNATWFMGWSGSTYARWLGLLQLSDHGRGFFVACPTPPSVVCHASPSHLLEHDFCASLGGHFAVGGANGSVRALLQNASVRCIFQ